MNSEMAYENSNQDFHECQCGVNSLGFLYFGMVEIACTTIWLVHNLACTQFSILFTKRNCIKTELHLAIDSTGSKAQSLGPIRLVTLMGTGRLARWKCVLVGYYGAYQYSTP